MIDLTGMTAGRLTAIRPDGTKVYKYRRSDGTVELRKRPLWLCSCECGEETHVTVDDFLNKRVKSCGCLRREKSRQNLEAAREKKQLTDKFVGEPITMGDHMRIARERAGLRQTELAQKAGLSHFTLGRMETNIGYCNLKNAVALADVLGISLDEYIGRKVENK